MPCSVINEVQVIGLCYLLHTLSLAYTNFSHEQHCALPVRCAHMHVNFDQSCIRLVDGSDAIGTVPWSREFPLLARLILGDMIKAQSQRNCPGLLITLICTASGLPSESSWHAYGLMREKVTRKQQCSLCGRVEIHCEREK